MLRHHTETSAVDRSEPKLWTTRVRELTRDMCHRDNDATMPNMRVLITAVLVFRLLCRDALEGVLPWWKESS